MKTHIAALLSAALLLVVMPPTLAGEVEGAIAEPESIPLIPRTKLELASPVNVVALEKQFDALGQMTIPVRGHDITLELRERDLFGERGREVWEVSDDATKARLVGYVTARALVGHVHGVQETHATITLDSGTNSLFGTVRMNERAYSLIGEPDASGQTMLRTVWDEKPESLPTQEEGGIGAMAIRYTYIRVFSDLNYRNYASNWQTRITNAFNEQHSMWDSYTEIHQYHGPFTSITGAWSSDCGSHIDSFESHVQSGINSGTYVGDDAYELFTGVDLSGVYGCANSYNTITMGSKDATAILEAVDHSAFDTYDPDESHNLGILSATELGHVYGEEDHPQDERCEAWWPWGSCMDYKWNVMAGGQDIDERTFWFTSGSSTKSADRIKAESWPQL